MASHAQGARAWQLGQDHQQAGAWGASSAWKVQERTPTLLTPMNMHDIVANIPTNRDWVCF